MLNCRLANQHGVKMASRYRTIFGQQLRLSWSKRDRFSPGKRSNQTELRADSPKNRLGWIEDLFKAVWNAPKIMKEHKVKLLSKLIETAVRFGLS